MQILINGKEKEVATEYTLFQLMLDLNLTNQKGIAVAINNSVQPKKKWKDIHLSENDNISIIQAIQGG